MPASGGTADRMADWQIILIAVGPGGHGHGRRPAGPGTGSRWMAVVATS